MTDLFVPRRLRRSRARGSNLQELSRSINGLPCAMVSRPGLWGNHAAVRAGFTTGQGAVDIFACWVATQASSAWKGAARTTLAGHNLACWCRLCPAHTIGGKPLDEMCPNCAPCHADVLGRLMCEPIETSEVADA